MIAYTAAGFAWLKQHLTAEVGPRLFRPDAPDKVERFEAANVLGLNFLLHNILARRGQPIAEHRYAGKDPGPGPAANGHREAGQLEGHGPALR